MTSKPTCACGKCNEKCYKCGSPATALINCKPVCADCFYILKKGSKNGGECRLRAYWLNKIIKLQGGKS